MGVSAQTLINQDKGKLHSHHTSGIGYRYYLYEQLNLNHIVIGHCR